MPDALLIDARLVVLHESPDEFRGCAGIRVRCAACAEEVIDGREVIRAGVPRYRSCAGETYYRDTTCLA